jgi:hypothetical protein
MGAVDARCYKNSLDQGHHWEETQDIENDRAGTPDIVETIP